MQVVMVHVVITYFAVTIMSAMDIAQQAFTNPPPLQTLSIFGVNDQGLHEYFKASMCKYLLVKFTESVKFTVK